MKKKKTNPKLVIAVSKKSKLAFDNAQRILAAEKKKKVTQDDAVYELAMYYLAEGVTK